MKRIGLLLLVLVVLAAPAFGREPVGALGFYADAAGNSCNLVDAGSGLLTYYVVHTFKPGEAAIGSRFKIVPPPGAAWAFITFQTTFTTIGQADSDVSVGYGINCQSTAFEVGHVLYSSLGTAAPACSHLTFGAGLPGFILGLQCNFAEKVIETGVGIMNPNAGCQCNVATQPSTWGQVKALYR
jgi:hypothetical protein